MRYASAMEREGHYKMWRLPEACGLSAREIVPEIRIQQNRGPPLKGRGKGKIVPICNIIPDKRHTHHHGCSGCQSVPERPRAFRFSACSFFSSVSVMNGSRNNLWR
jgi:hypothetical protein